MSRQSGDTFYNNEMAIKIYKSNWETKNIFKLIITYFMLLMFYIGYLT